MVGTSLRPALQCAAKNLKCAESPRRKLVNRCCTSPRARASSRWAAVLLKIVAAQKTGPGGIAILAGERLLAAWRRHQRLWPSDSRIVDACNCRGGICRPQQGQAPVTTTAPRDGVTGCRRRSLQCDSARRTELCEGIRVPVLTGGAEPACDSNQSPAGAARRPIRSARRQTTGHANNDLSPNPMTPNKPAFIGGAKAGFKSLLQTESAGF